MKKYTYILGIAYMIISLVTVTFAWMSQGDIFEGFPQIKYGSADDDIKLSIISTDIDFEVYARIGDDYTLLDDLDELLEVNDIVPGQAVYFRLVFTNNSETIQNISLHLSGITTDSSLNDNSIPEIFDYMYFGVTKISGYAISSTHVPTNAYICFNDGIRKYTFNDETNYSLTLYNDIYIPLSSESENIQIDGYFLLSRLTTTEMEDIRISVGNFMVIV